MGSEITVGNISNATGVAIGHGARAVVLRFSLFNRLQINWHEPSVLDLDPELNLARPPLVPPHPHNVEPELNNLLGRNAELAALVQLMQATLEGQHGGMVWILGESGSGRKALARRLASLAADAQLSEGSKMRRANVLTLTTRFWDTAARPVELEPMYSTEPRGKASWREWAYYIRQSFPRASLVAGPAWVALMSQMAMQLGEFPQGLPDTIASLTALIRQALVGHDLGILLLEDCDWAPAAWDDWLESLARETQTDLKLIVLNSIRSTAALAPSLEAGHLGRLKLAAHLSAHGLASSLWLGALDYDDFANSFSMADALIPQTLFHMAGGRPLWIEKLWEDWLAHDLVERDREHGWRRTQRFGAAVGGGVKDYADYLLECALQTVPTEFSFTHAEAAELLRCAALEGPVFTVAAVAAACDFYVDVVDDFFAECLCGSDGLLASAGATFVTLPSANLDRRLQLYRFAPAAGFFVFNRYSTPAEQAPLAYRLADALEAVYWPFPEQVAATLFRLFQLGGRVAPNGLGVKAEQPQSPRKDEHRESERNQRMAKYGQLPADRSSLESQRFQVEFLEVWAHDDASKKRFVNAAIDLAERLSGQRSNIEAIRYALPALQVARSIHWVEGQARANLCVGLIAFANGRIKHSQRILRRALAFFEQLGRLDGIGACRQGLGELAMVRGEYDEAQEHYQQALALSEQLGQPVGIATCRQGLGVLARIRGAYDQAQDHLQRALALSEQMGRLDGVAACRQSLGEVAMERGAYDEAQEHYQRALALSEQLGQPVGIALCRYSVGELAMVRGEYDEAQEHYQRALALNAQLGRRDDIASCWQSLGELAVVRGAYEQAQDHLQRALALNAQLGRPAGIARCWQSLGELAVVRGACDQAKDHLQRALDLYRQLGVARAIETIQAKLDETDQLSSHVTGPATQPK